MSELSQIMALGVASGTVLVFDHVITSGEMWTGSGKRWARAEVVFETPFDSPPHVQLTLQMIDSDQAHNLRLALSAEAISRTGFQAVAHTWNATRIGRLSLSWLAIGEKSTDWDV